jgi:predicted membrane GTPase involved in stress response
VRLIIEFSPTDGLEDGGKLLVQTSTLKQVRIIDMRVSKLSTVEGLVLLHLLSATDGDVIAIRSLRNVIVCKIMARPRGPMQRWHEG